MMERKSLELKGAIFEIMIADYLRGNFPDCEIIHNVTIPSRTLKKGNTQVDVILVCEKAIVVIEAKDWSRHIQGLRKENTWHGLGSNPAGMTVVSPIKQNQHHIRMLKAKILKEGLRTPQMSSLVVMPDSCEIKTDCTEVISISDLRANIEKIVNSSNKTIKQITGRDYKEIAKILRE